MKIKCPCCPQQYEVPESDITKRFRCIFCDHVFRAGEAVVNDPQPEVCPIDSAEENVEKPRLIHIPFDREERLPANPPGQKFLLHIVLIVINVILLSGLGYFWLRNQKLERHVTIIEKELGVNKNGSAQKLRQLENTDKQAQSSINALSNDQNDMYQRMNSIRSEQNGSISSLESDVRDLKYDLSNLSNSLDSYVSRRDFNDLRDDVRKLESR